MIEVALTAASRGAPFYTSTMTVISPFPRNAIFRTVSELVVDRSPEDVSSARKARASAVVRRVMKKRAPAIDG